MAPSGSRERRSAQQEGAGPAGGRGTAAEGAEHPSLRATDDAARAAGSGGSPSDASAAAADLTAAFQSAAAEWHARPVDAYIERVQRLLAACTNAMSALEEARSVGLQPELGERFSHNVAAMLEAATGALRFLVAAADGKRQSDSSVERRNLLDLATSLTAYQSRALCSALAMTADAGGQLADAVPPGPFHAWLLESAALFRGPEHHFYADTVAPGLAQLLCLMNDARPHRGSEHCAALQQDAALCSQLVSALLLAVQRRAADVATTDPPTADSCVGTLWLVCALCSPLLRQTCTQHLRGEGGAAALESAAQLVLCIPPNFGGLENTPEQDLEAHCQLAALLCAVCKAQLGPVQGSRKATGRMLQLLPQLLRRLGSLLQLGSRAAATSPMLLVQLCSSWAVILGSCGLALKRTCPLPASGPAAAGEQPSGAQRGTAPLADAQQCWAAYAAAAAALRLLPQLLDASQALTAAAAGMAFEEECHREIMSEAAETVGLACLCLADAVRAHLAATVELTQAHTWPEVQLPMWQLHSTACRLLHWAQSGGEAEQQRRVRLLPLLGQEHLWLTVAGLLGGLMSAAAAGVGEAMIYLCHFDSNSSVVEQLDGPCKAMAMAHLAAMCSCNSAPHGVAALGISALRPSMAGSYLYAAAAAGLALCVLDPDFRAQIGSCWRAMPPLQAAEPSQDQVHDVQRYIAFLLRVADFHAAPVAEVLVLDGHLAALLRQAADVQQQVLRSPQAVGAAEHDRQQLLIWVSRLPATVLRVVALIYRSSIAAAAAGAGGSESDMPSSAGNSACSDAAAEPAHGALERHAAALQAAFEAAGLTALLQADRLQPLQACSVPTAQRLCAASLRLAAALLEYWQQPEQTAQAQLEAAQAASARSCAYLCCANLGGQGGPAAGEGKGSARCSACRSVWYCGTACSHADWRAGHRRVCKALGAARAAEKERRRQEAAAAD